MKTRILLSAILICTISLNSKTNIINKHLKIEPKSSFKIVKYEFNETEFIGKLKALKSNREDLVKIRKLKEAEVMKINQNIKILITKIEAKIEEDTITIDSICIENRGFIGNKIFKKGKCKKWQKSINKKAKNNE